MDLEQRVMKVHQICQRVTGGLTYLETESRLCRFWLKKHLKENALPEDITFAAMRNTYICSLMEAGTDFIQVSVLSGCWDLNELWKKYGAFYGNR